MTYQRSPLSTSNVEETIASIKNAFGKRHAPTVVTEKDILNDSHIRYDMKTKMESLTALIESGHVAIIYGTGDEAPRV